MPLQLKIKRFPNSQTPLSSVFQQYKDKTLPQNGQKEKRVVYTEIYKILKTESSTLHGTTFTFENSDGSKVSSSINIDNPHLLENTLTLLTEYFIKFIPELASLLPVYPEGNIDEIQNIWPQIETVITQIRDIADEAIVPEKTNTLENEKRQNPPPICETTSAYESLNLLPKEEQPNNQAVAAVPTTWEKHKGWWISLIITVAALLISILITAFLIAFPPAGFLVTTALSLIGITATEGAAATTIFVALGAVASLAVSSLAWITTGIIYCSRCATATKNNHDYVELDNFEKIHETWATNGDPDTDVIKTVYYSNPTSGNNQRPSAPIDDKPSNPDAQTVIAINAP